MSVIEQIIPNGYKQTEVGIIPEDWDVTTIEELAAIIDPQPDHRTPPESSNGEPYVGISDFVNSKEVDWASSRKIISKAVDKQERSFQLKKGDIVFGKIGTIGVPKFVPQVPFRFALSANVILLQPKKVEPVYLMEFFYSELFQQTLKAELHSTSQAAFGMNKMRLIKLPLPPKEEQTAIANALSDVDALLTELEKLLAKKQAIKTASMQQLLTGKTRLPQFAYKEVATDTEGEKQGQPKGSKPSELGEIPEDWDVQPLSKLSTYINDGTHHTPTYTRDGIPFYSVENVSANDFYNVKYISEEEHKKLIKRCKPEKGDILMTRIGTLGVTRVIDWEVDASIYVSLALIKLRQEVRPEYVYSFSKSSIFKQEVEKRSLVNATPQKINMIEIGQVPILFPKNEEEQTAIATILSDMDNEIQTLEQRLAKTRQIKQGMMQELLTGRTRLPISKGAV